MGSAVRLSIRDHGRILWLCSWSEIVVLLNIDNRENRLGVTKISIIDIYCSFFIMIDVMTLAINKKVDLH